MGLGLGSGLGFCAENSLPACINVTADHLEHFEM